jgi:outer membrane protein OmpA-like peptidoglycan-associated protein
MWGGMMRRRLRVNGWCFLCGIGAPVLFGLTGCLATQGWVQKHMTPLAQRVSDVDERLGQSEARLQLIGRKADVALDRLDSLRLEKRLVLNLKDGAQFAFDSAALTQETRRQIDRFVDGMKDANDTLFVVVGHTDSRGLKTITSSWGRRGQSVWLGI